MSDGAFVRKVTHQSGQSGTAGELNATSFSVDGSMFATGINDHGAKIWRTSDGALLYHLNSTRTADGVDFSLNGSWFASGASNMADVFALPGFNKVASITHAAGSEVNSLHFNASSSLLATAGGTGDGTVKITRTSDWVVQRTISVGASVKSVRFSNDGSMVALGARNQLCRVHRVSDGALLKNLIHKGNQTPLPGDDNDTNAAVEAVAWSNDGNYLFSSGLIDGVMRVWRVADWSLVDWVQAQQANRAIEYIDVSNQNKVVVGGDEGSIYLYQFTPPTIQQPFRQDSGAEGLVSIEAESADTRVAQGGHSWNTVSDTSSSGGTKLQALPNSGANKNTGYQTYDPKVDSPKLDFRVNFVKTGTHYVWVRGKGGDPDNSVHVGLNGNPVDTADRIEFGTSGTSSWMWTKNTKDGPVATINIPSTGNHTINLWMREDGTEVDKLVITTSASYAPSGNGPAQSARGTGGGTPSPTAIKINFQPGSAASYSGYLVDDGSTYGARNGQTYGWNTSNTANARDRNAANAPDQRYDTFNHMQLNGTFTWELAVANGTYSVKIVAGDPSYFDSVYKINAENVTVVNGTPSSGTRWVEGTANVAVSDGRLTVTSASGASNNKIAFIEVTPN